MNVEVCTAGGEVSVEKVDDADLQDSCNKNFDKTPDFDFHPRIFHREMTNNSQEYTLNQASARRIRRIIGAKAQVVNFSLKECQNSCDMILYGAERETPIHVNSMLFECLSKVILEAPIENEEEMKTENATPVKVIEIVDETNLHRIVQILNGGTIRMTPSEQLGLFTSLRALAMGEFCGAIVPQESAPAPVDVEVSEEEEDSEWPNPIGAVPTVKRKRGRPRTREPMIGPKRPRGRPRLPENMLRERRESKKSFRVGSGIFKMPAAIASFKKKVKGSLAARESSGIESMDLSKVKARMAERWSATKDGVSEEICEDVEESPREMRVQLDGLKMTIRPVGSK